MVQNLHQTGGVSTYSGRRGGKLSSVLGTLPHFYREREFASGVTRRRVVQQTSMRHPPNRTKTNISLHLSGENAGTRK